MNDPSPYKPKELTLFDVSALSLVIILLLIWFFTTGVTFFGTNCSRRIQCANNLKEIGKLAEIYCQQNGVAYFPFDDSPNPSSHNALNQIVDFYASARKVNPKLFNCPEWEHAPAIPDSEKLTYRLDEKSNSYTWTTKKIQRDANNSNIPLSSDKVIRNEKKSKWNGHKKGKNVLYVDNSVKWVHYRHFSRKEFLESISHLKP